jgi:hypothetical protein
LDSRSLFTRYVASLLTHAARSLYIARRSHLHGGAMHRDGSFGIGRDGAFEVRQLGADGHFALVGELDRAAVDNLIADLRSAINRAGTITLDLRELPHRSAERGRVAAAFGGGTEMNDGRGPPSPHVWAGPWGSAQQPK